MDALLELGFRGGFEEAIRLVESFETWGIEAKDVPRYIAAWLLSLKDWRA